MTLINKINNAKNEFVTGFKSGYNEATGNKDIKVVAVDGEPVAEPTVSAKTGAKLGVVIAMIAKFFKSRTARMLFKVLGIAAALTSAVLNIVFIGTVSNFIVYVLPLLVLATWGVYTSFDGTLNFKTIDEHVALGTLTVGSSVVIGLTGIMSTLFWLFAGNPLMALAVIGLYIAPLMVWINK